MIRSRSTWLVGLLACGALITGCGSSSKPTSSSQSSSSSSSPATTATTSSTPTTSSTNSSKSGTSLQAEIATCKHEIASQSTLPAGAKAKLEAVCGEAAKGNTAAVKKAAREVCEEVIDKSPVPASDKQQALAACKAK
jgi:hypothetical protein